MDETLMLMALLPWVGMYFRRLHAWWHLKRGHEEHEEGSMELWKTKLGFFILGAGVATLATALAFSCGN